MNSKHIILILAIVLLGFAPATAQRKIYLVSVGIADYPGSDMDLTLCANDANTIKWIFQKNNKAETITLTNRKATIQAVKAAMESEFMKATADDAILFFFSGHGAPGSLVCYDGLLDYQVIKKVMARSKAKYKMIFADACYSGKMRRANPNTSYTVPDDLKKAEVMFFLSSRSNETSIESPSMKNGFFTAFLQRGLRGGADANNDRIVTAREIFEFVSKGVIKLSGDRQHPVMWGKFDNDMPVISW